VQRLLQRFHQPVPNHLDHLPVSRILARVLNPVPELAKTNFC
jgi:hypothetical protein